MESPFSKKKFTFMINGEQYETIRHALIESTGCTFSEEDNKLLFSLYEDVLPSQFLEQLTKEEQTIQLKFEYKALRL